MTTHYKTVTKMNYAAGIYDNCLARIQTNGRRYRVQADLVRWVGNTGGIVRKTIYLDLDRGRALLRRYRQAHCRDLRGNWYNNRWDVLRDVI